MERTILHCDCNSFYASVECTLRPELWEVPMAVCGDPESRHGIILAKNERAKAFGVQTAETIWQAKRKCPQLTLVAPHREEYQRLSVVVNGIYREYTDLVEPFGIDESWLDVTGTTHLFGAGPEIADLLRRRVKEETGLTISVGVSFCKVFAKLGSDYKKPDATTVIRREDVPRIVYPMPVTALLYVGKSAASRLASLGIYTIGDLAQSDAAAVTALLGKTGASLHDLANGMDDSPVASAYAKREVKSVGNGFTFRRNLTGMEDIRTGVTALADTVASRLRKAGVACFVVQVVIKDPSFRVISRQMTLQNPTCFADEIASAALKLIGAAWNPEKPIRMLTITGANLVPIEEAGEQQSLFAPETGRRRERQEHLSRAIDAIREKFGKGAIAPGSIVHNDLGIGRAQREDEEEKDGTENPTCG